ncbi:MAG TPA: 50S ribosomal protein L21 [Candidatus Limnocylindrales bacterium]|nr:50S ribosomal protein L21 [Candidatus Limnocylindrales bacterium]
MYAVIETGGKQYRVELGSEVAIERLEGAPGDTIKFDRVLLVSDGDSSSIGTPMVADALVTGEVLRQDRGEKVIVFKYRPKARHRAKKGHRQEQTVVRVADIQFNGRSAADEAQVTEQKEAKSKKAANAEAERKAAADAELAAKLAATAETEAAQATEADAAEAKPAAKSTAKPKATSTKASTAVKASTTAKTSAKAAKPAKPKTEPKTATQSSGKTSPAKPQSTPDED